MISKSAARIFVAALLLGSLLITSRLTDSDVGTSATAKAHADPTFEVLWTGRELTVKGHTQSESHEADLRRLVISHFPDARTEIRFEPMGTVPAHWVDATLKSLQLLSTTRSAVARISKDKVAIGSVTSDESRWRNRVDDVRTALPNRISVTANSLPVDTAIDVSRVCEQAFDSLEVGAVQFQESTTALRTSAYPRLERVAALAKTCRNSRIVVTGHADASGDEAVNVRLSLARARAVGDFFTARGIDSDRVVVIGAGSAQPVANNGTRYGRSLNRRIEIDLQNY